MKTQTACALVGMVTAIVMSDVVQMTRTEQSNED